MLHTLLLSKHMKKWPDVCEEKYHARAEEWTARWERRTFSTGVEITQRFNYHTNIRIKAYAPKSWINTVCFFYRNPAV